ncbi:TonB-dependent receptor [Persicobacter sp. CCB-QB2]|uniref:TonB-dependent receptor n=1 Tax=Persicobacter sp. CCB-QB2 TaxID=1561025 RepID=UPI0009E262D2|nr:TonB-dependent receptor [Persicobacter sp. CCB-QB2]
MRIVPFFFFFLLHIATWAQSPSLSGRVLDHDTKEPLMGVAIFLDNGKINTLTDEDGNFFFPQIKDGHYTVHAQYLGYLHISKDLIIHKNIKRFNFLMEPEIRQLDQVIIKSEEGERFKKQSQSVELIDQDYFDKNRGATFVDALTNKAGINAISTGVGISKPVIRGMFGNRVVVNDGGVKQESQQWGNDHGLPVDNFNTNKVEIIKGPASLLYGSDGIGGVIKIDEPTVPTLNEISGQAITNYQSNNKAIGGGMQLKGNHHGHYFILEGSYNSFNNYRVPADDFKYLDFVFPLKENTLVNTGGYDQSLGLNLGTAQKWGRINLNVSDYQQTVGLFPGAVGTPTFGWLDNFPTSSRNPDIPRQVNQHSKAILNTDLKIGEDWLKITLGAQYNQRQEQSNPNAHPADYPEYREPGNVAHGLYLQTYTADILYKLTSVEDWEINLGAGGQFQHHHFDGFEFLLPNYQTQSAYFTGFVQKTLNEKWTLNGGARLDFYHYDVDQFNDSSRFEPGSRSGYWINRSPEINRTEANWSGAIGFAYNHDQNWSTKFNIGKTFRMPTVAELTMNGVHHGTFRHEQGDANLKAEQGIQIDWSVAWENYAWKLEFNPYFNYFSNYIYLAPSGIFSPLPDAGQIYQYREAEAIHTGFEFAATFRPTDNWEFTNAFEYLYNINLDTNLPLPFTPPVSNYLESIYHFGHVLHVEDIYVGAGYRATAAQNRVDRNELTTPGYHLFNVQAGLKVCYPKTQLNVIFRIDNLTNVAYYNHLSRYRLLNLPEQGRNVSITVKLNF